MVGTRRLWEPAVLTCFLVIVASAQDWQVLESQTIAPGVFYQALRRATPPTWVRVVRIPLPMPQGLKLAPVLGGVSSFGRQPLTQIAQLVQQNSGYVTAGINGDYFTTSLLPPYSGDPLGLHIQNGELISLPWGNRSALVGLVDGRVVISSFKSSARLRLPEGTETSIDGLNQNLPPNGFCLFTPAFGLTTQTPPGTIEVIATANLPLRPNTPLTLIVRQVNEAGSSPIPRDGVVLAATGRAAALAKSLRCGDRLEVLITLIPLDAEFEPKAMLWAIGGGPRLLRDGKISIECEREGFSPSFRQTKHPRTAVGLRDDALIWVVVDGRQPGYSEGMSLDELAEFLSNAGCKDALNLDGGGSSTLFVRGEVVNQPSDGRERPIANALLLLNLFSPQPIMRIFVSSPPNVHWLSGTLIPLRVIGEDAVYRLLPLSAGDVDLKLTPEIEGWRWDGQNLWLPPMEGDEGVDVTIAVMPKVGNASPAILTLCVHPKPSAIMVHPNNIVVPPGASVKLQLNVLGKEKDNRLVPLQFDLKEVQWQVKGGVGEVFDGRFVAAQTSCVKEGALIASLRGVTTMVKVCVGRIQWMTLHEFDDMNGLRVVGYPETVKVAGQIVTNRKRSGKGALLLRYDFSGGGKTRTASVVLNKILPPNSCRLGIDVYGDGSGCWFRARLRDATGKPFFLDIADSLNWSGEWKHLEVNLPSNLVEPLTLEAIYLAVIRDEQRPVGAVLLDNLQVSAASVN